MDFSIKVDICRKRMGLSILYLKGSQVDFLFGLRFYYSYGGYGQVETVSLPNHTCFPGQA